MAAWGYTTPILAALLFVMTTQTRTITLAITGASGIQYGLKLLECLLESNVSVMLLVSDAARQVAAYETDDVLPQDPSELKQYLCTRMKALPSHLFVYGAKEWTSPVASGSFKSAATVVCPCSCKSLSAFAHGASSNLIERAVDVALKEKRPLILVPRETPLSVIHLKNMLTLAQAGALILPASPGFYHRPQSVDDLIFFIVARILDHLQVNHSLLPWGARI